MYPQNTDPYQKDICSTMLIAALFIIVRNWKQRRYPSTKEWIKKMWYIYTIEYYSVVKGNDILKLTGRWMELKKIILSEVTQTQKDKYHMYLLISGN